MVRTNQPIPKERPESPTDSSMRCRYCGSSLELILAPTRNEYLQEYDLDHWRCISCTRRFSLEEARAYQP
jgi:DNA-directed RNA polymerase subunit RPC12/RpoP